MTEKEEEIIGFLQGKALTDQGKSLTLSWDPVTRVVRGVPVVPEGVDQVGGQRESDKGKRWRTVDQL